MCPHPLASADCLLLHALLAVPCAMAAVIFSISMLLRWGRRGVSALRFGLSLAGALPSGFLAAVAASTVFLRLDLFRARHDERLIFLGLLALTLALQSLYLLALRPRGKPAQAR